MSNIIYMDNPADQPRVDACALGTTLSGHGRIVPNGTGIVAANAKAGDVFVGAIEGSPAWSPPIC